MKILITGAYGFIGFHLANFLYSKGHQICLIDNFFKNQDTEEAHIMYEEFVYDKNICSFDLDLTDFSNVDWALTEKEFDIVFHLAAINGTENFYRRPTKIIENNFLATMNVLKNIKCKKFVFTSSCEAYASTVNQNICDIPTNEKVLLSVEDIMNPRWSYGGTKILEELYVKNYCTENNIDFLILRYHNIYGIRDSLKHVIPALFKRCFSEEDFVNIYGNCTRSFLYIKDCIEYTMRLAESKHCKNDIYNVGMQEEVSIKEVVQNILSIFNVNKLIKIYDKPEGSVLRRCPDMQKTINATGFKPKYNLYTGLNEMAWYYEKKGIVI
jgi:nucleoside-diphosphate-sugar epimerase